MVTRAVATHRTMSTAEGGLLSCMGVPAPGALVHKHEPYSQASNTPTTATLAAFLTADTHRVSCKAFPGQHVNLLDTDTHKQAPAALVSKSMGAVKSCTWHTGLVLLNHK